MANHKYTANNRHLRYSTETGSASSLNWNSKGGSGYGTYTSHSGRVRLYCSEDTAVSDRSKADPHAKQKTSRQMIENNLEENISDFSRSRETLSKEYAKRRKKEKRYKVIAITLAVILAVCVGVAGVALGLWQQISTNLNEGLDQRVNDVLVSSEYTKEPFYVLVMGTDESQARDESGDLEGIYRTDSMMLVRIDVPDMKVTVVSLPRDTMIDLGEYGTQKLNAAHAFGGAALAIETVADLADVDISHYVEINFDGFVAIVDSLGGIEVDVPIEIDDEEAGGYLAPGLQTLNGEQALILCRSRHSYDDYGDGDTYRAANQRLVLTAIAKKMLASDLVTLTNTITQLSDYVSTDMKVTDIIGLAQALRGLDTTTSLYTCGLPTESEYIDDVWYEILQKDEWKLIMARVDAGLSPTEDNKVDELTGTVMATAGKATTASSDITQDTPAPVLRSGTVAIRNGSGKDGVGTRAAEKVAALGYTTDVGNADEYDYQETLVVYEEPEQQQYAQEIVDALGCGHTVQNEDIYAFSTDYLVVVGADFE